MENAKNERKILEKKQLVSLEEHEPKCRSNYELEANYYQLCC